MELKVWVEGIQRVVCGVNEATTCQDVVYALAHATGQTGRFTLVEKWRHSERLLPPQEHPLKVLTKWGEYAGDVQLILRRSSDKKTQNNNNKNVVSQPTQQQQLPSKRLPGDLRPFSPPNVPTIAPPHPATPVQNKEIKKSLTFSGSHGSNSSTSSSSSSGQSTPQNVTTPGNSVHNKTEHGWDPQGKGRDRDSNRVTRQDLPRGIVKGVPQERSSPARPRQPPSYDEAVSRSSRHHLSSQLSPFNPEKDSPSSKRNQLGVGPRISPMTAKEQRLSPNRTADPYVHHIMSHSPSGNDYKRETGVTSPLVGSSPKDSHWSTEKAKARKNLIGEFKKDSSPKLEKEPNAENVVVLVKDNEDPQYRDLIRLVSLQREKMNNQNAELSQFDTEIVYWEGKLQEQESRLAVLEEEMRRLERLNEEQSQELVGLDQSSQVENLEGAHQDERVLRSKLSVTRAQLASCETQINHNRQRIRHLGEELSGKKERRKNLEREKEAREREDQCQEIKKQMNKKENEQSQQLEILSSLEKEMQVLEDGLSDRQSQLEKLTVELREANLQALSMTIADDIKCLSEGSFHTRSGSTRRIMGSPRQLENAVPTSKNPHGVWV